jgi:aminopeptidase N
MVLLLGAVAHADEPYARSKDYDLQNIRTHLWFDLAQRSIRGEADESIAASRDDVAQIKLDSVGLTIQAVTVDGKPAKFSTTADQSATKFSSVTKAAPKRASISSSPTPTIPASPRKSGRRAKPRTPAITSRSTIIPTTA